MFWRVFRANSQNSCSRVVHLHHNRVFTWCVFSWWWACLESITFQSSRLWAAQWVKEVVYLLLEVGDLQWCTKSLFCSSLSNITPCCFFLLTQYYWLTANKALLILLNTFNFIETLANKKLWPHSGDGAFRLIWSKRKTQITVSITSSHCLIML